MNARIAQINQSSLMQAQREQINTWPGQPLVRSTIQRAKAKAKTYPIFVALRLINNQNSTPYSIWVSILLSIRRTGPR
jgi:hypothetical protein